MPTIYMPNLRQHAWSRQDALSGGHGIRQLMRCKGCEFGEQNFNTLSDHVLSVFLLKRHEFDFTRSINMNRGDDLGFRELPYMQFVNREHTLDGEDLGSDIFQRDFW